MKRRTLSVVVVLLIGLGIAGLVGWRLLHWFDDPLVYCQKVLDAGFEQWKMANKTKTYPNVQGMGRESLALIAVYAPADYADGMLRDYGYVPGLCEGDPNDLVMMYLKKKTRRTWNGDSSPTVFTRRRWMVLGPKVIAMEDVEEHFPEGGRLEDSATFKARLLKTLAFLKENNRPHWETVSKEHTAFLVSMED